MKRAGKHPTSALFALTLAVSASACASCDTGGDGTQERMPFRDGWQVEADVDFIHTTADGLQIFDLAIGGRESNDNFANRGDVIVNFDGPANKILVELRRFTFATNEDAAQNDFDNLSLWAYTSALGRPQDMSAEDACDEGAWQNGCAARVYYDGLSQLQRSGADIRVTLPPDYRYQLSITTEDNVADDDYFNRGNVCVSNLNASVDIETKSGNAWVTVARETTPAPKCSQQQIDDCENWTVKDEDDNDVPAPWAPECPCIAVGGGEFGRVFFENRDDSASNVTVDVASTLWTSIRTENRGEMQQAQGDHCDALIEVPGAALEAQDFPWRLNGDVNFPGEPAIKGAGFAIQTFSNNCSPVAYTEEPGDFVGVGRGQEQESEERGNVRVCTDCITQSCNDLIP